MEYQSERERLGMLAGHAMLAQQPGGGVGAARAIVQALQSTRDAFDYALARIDETHPELAAHLPAWYTATRALAAECAIVAQWWTEELAREPMRWTAEHSVRLAEDAAHFEQLRARAVDELAEPVPAAAFATVAIPDLEPWRENLPPRGRRWHLLAWPVVAAVALGVGVAGFHAFEHGHTTMSGVFNGNSGPAAAGASPAATDTASPAPSPSPAGPSTTAASAAPSTDPATATTAPTPTRTPAAPAAPSTAAAGTAPEVSISLIPADGYPQIEALFTITTRSTAPTTLYVTSYGVTRSGARTAENFSSRTLSGRTNYTYTEVIHTSAWCGDTVTVEATAAGGSAVAHTGAGC